MTDDLDHLTPRQREVFNLLDDGLGAREIGEQLGISRNAVYQVISALKAKGELDDTFTPTGVVHVDAASLEDVPTQAMEMIDHLTQMNLRLMDLVKTLVERQQ